ncbi:hypothetical protein WICMUC_000198 [Wickerhamomyces mucosus]|uniref:Prefoldin subunit 1 n=1 Tax=Wickerhamomyces mucosus TaxID=1378264 RepID=A0A9P8TJ22_9ASCO|nr:hypothetical protein WICMUC_000198 [Wickerhamomyces mucosus]
MSVSQAQLESLLIEMNSQLQKNQADLQMVQVQLDRHSTNSRIADLTIKELNDNGSENNTVWEGIGKMFLASNIKNYEERLNIDKKIIDDQVKALNIKKNYLTTSIEKTSKSMKAILSGKPLEE